MDVVSPQASIHILQDLTPFRIYRVTVSAVNDVGQGQEEEATFETAETRAWMIFYVLCYCLYIAIFISYVVPTGVASRPRFSDLATTSVVFIWDDVICAERGGDLVSYNVEVKPSSCIK